MQSINLTPTPQLSQVANYLAIQPILAAIKASNDKMPKSSLPIETFGTIQQNTHLIATPTTIYNEHGKIIQSTGNVIARA